MKATLDALIEQALLLPVDERARLVAAIDASLEEPDEMPPDIRAAWDVEIQRRIQEIDDGTADLIDGDEVMEDMRAWLAAARASQQR